MAAAASPPTFPDGLRAEQAATVLTETVRRTPPLSGWSQSRWTLALLRQSVGWLARLTVGGVGRLRHRLGVVYRRGQAHLHSPDPAYAAQLAAVAAARAPAAERPNQVVLVYQDEFTYYRRPSVASAWGPSGGPGLSAEQGYRPNRKRRVVGSLDARDGRLFVWQRERAGVATLKGYYRALEAAYPEAEVIYVAQDNWPVHFHAELVQALAHSKIRLLRLPTYAPWTNPIEKVWRWLNQDVGPMHSFRDDGDGLPETVTAWWDRWSMPSLRLLRYVGLDPD